MARVVRQYGIRNWRRVFRLEENRGLREQGRQPHLLQPGDNVFVPDRVSKRESCDVNRAHEFVVDEPPHDLIVELQGVPASQVGGLYKLEAGTDTFNGILRADGRIQQAIRYDVEEAKLTIEPNRSGQVFDGVKGRSAKRGGPGQSSPQIVAIQLVLKVGFLSPAAETRGVQERLANLGYYGGELDGDAGGATKAAIADFRQGTGLPQGEEIDEGLIATLRERHGC
ncbi:MAG: peptidoglycan-binding domain-containing protein [Nannocystaceae bacterium]